MSRGMYLTESVRRAAWFWQMAQHPIRSVMHLRSADTGGEPESDPRIEHTNTSTGGGLVRTRDRGVIFARHRPAPHRIFGGSHSIEQAYPIAANASFEIARAQRYTNPGTTPLRDRPGTD